jgi:imidazolonepropionase-like amidohydrolase
MTATAIVNANVYDHETGKFFKGSVLIEKEKIKAVTAAENGFDGCSKIDAEGCFLTPGFIDTCSQIGLKETGLRWEGDDSFEPMGEETHRLQVIDGIYPFDPSFHEAVSNGVTAAHVVSSPGSVTGARTAVIHTWGITVDQMVLRKHLGYSFSLGDIPKRTFWERTKTPLTRMGIARQIRNVLKKLKKNGNLAETSVFFRCHRADDIMTAFRIAREFDIPFHIIHGTEYAKVKDELPAGGISVIAGPCFQPMDREELRNLDYTMYRTLFDNNVPFTFATDHPTGFVRHLHLEGVLALKAGVPEKTVLNSLTSDAARLLKIDHLTGKIQRGLYADLVLWSQHPLDLTARAVRTFIKGKQVYHAG